MKPLIVYFSAEGKTRKFASEAAKELNIDIFEIKPVEPYTKADINWINPLSRCNIEKAKNKDVPSLLKIDNFSKYDTIFIGFPIWYWGAPNIVNTFVKDYDFKDKKVVVFATSISSPIGKTAEKLKPYLKNVNSLEAFIVKSTSDLKKIINL